MSEKLVIGLLIFCSLRVSPQNAPFTSLPDIPQAVPGTIEVPVTVLNFDDIGAVYLSIDYDYSVLQLTSATPHPQMPTFIHGDSDLGTGYHRITMGWYGNGLTLPDGSAIMTLSFHYTAGYTELVFYDSGPSCEYANGDGQVLNDIPTWQYYYNGWICGALTSPGPITGESIVCQGRHAVSYSVEPMPNAADYVWDVPVGEATILCGQHTNLILVDWKDDAQSCDVKVWVTSPCNMTSATSVLPVTVYPVPVADAGSSPPIGYGSFTFLHGSVNGPGDFSYHWSPEELVVDPDEQVAQTVMLTSSTIFTLLVTNLETGCQDEDDMAVWIIGGPLSINPTAIADSICDGGTSLLYSLASGGSNYTYSWISDPPGWSSTQENTSITPDTTSLCILTVTDGVNSVTDSVMVTVLEQTTAVISGSDTLCGDEGSTVLTVDLTGTPPWDFVYTFGLQSVHVTGQMDTPFQLVTGEQGTYSIPFVKDHLCDGSGAGSSLVAQYPIPPAPVITLIENTLISNLSWGNQWYKDDEPIPGATGVSYSVTETGNYYDIVTRFGCASDTSNNMYIVIPGIPENTRTRTIFPNPAREKINIPLIGDSHTPNYITIFTLQGNPVLATTVYASSPDHTTTLDISPLQAGIYFLQYTSGDSTLVHKIIILP